MLGASAVTIQDILYIQDRKILMGIYFRHSDNLTNKWSFNQKKKKGLYKERGMLLLH